MRRGLKEYVAQIDRFLEGRACVSGTLGWPAKKFAADLFQENIPIEQVGRGITLGCARWYITVLNGKPLSPIASVKYFASTIDEAGSETVPTSYWPHVRRRAYELEQAWLRKSPANAPGRIAPESEAA